MLPQFDTACFSLSVAANLAVCGFTSPRLQASSNTTPVWLQLLQYCMRGSNTPVDAATTTISLGHEVVQLQQQLTVQQQVNAAQEMLACPCRLVRTAQRGDNSHTPSRPCLCDLVYTSQGASSSANKKNSQFATVNARRFWASGFQTKEGLLVD